MAQPKRSGSPQSKKPTARKDKAAVYLGRKGGKVGGKATARALSPAQRSENARRAAVARWHGG